MKSELKVAPHLVKEGHNVIEIWYDGKFIGQVTGGDGPGIRLVSKHPKLLQHVDELVMEILLVLP